MVKLLKKLLKVKDYLNADVYFDPETITCIAFPSAIGPDGDKAVLFFGSSNVALKRSEASKIIEYITDAGVDIVLTEDIILK